MIKDTTFYAIDYFCHLSPLPTWLTGVIDRLKCVAFISLLLRIFAWVAKVDKTFKDTTFNAIDYSCHLSLLSCRQE